MFIFVLFYAILNIKAILPFDLENFLVLLKIKNNEFRKVTISLKCKEELFMDNTNNKGTLK